MNYYSSSSNRLQSTVRFFSHRAFLFVLVFLAVVILFLGRADSNVISSMRDGIAQSFSGIFGMLSSPVTMVRDSMDDAQSMMLLFEENKRLKEENERLREWKALAEKLQLTVARYEALLNVQVDPGIEVITGRAVAETGGAFIRTMVINVGTEQGVSKGQAVVNAQGLVGRVLGAGRTSSRVILLTDLDSRVPVMIGPDGERAILQGDNTASPRLEFLMALQDVKPGSPVMTSGDAGLLPKGLPIGVIKGREGDRGYYRVDWAASGAPIDYVRILKYEFPKYTVSAEEDLPAALLEAVRDGAAPEETSEEEAPAGEAPAGPAAEEQ